MPSGRRPGARPTARPRVSRLPVLLHSLPGGPRLHAQAPQAHEPLGVLVPEAVGGLVGRQVVVVEADLAAAAGDEATARDLTLEAHLTGDEALALVHEGIERLLERREPEAVVHQLGVARLEPGLLMGQVAFEREVFEVG